MQDKNWISVTVSRKIGTLFCEYTYMQLNYTCSYMENSARRLYTYINRLNISASAVPMFCLLGVSYASDKNTVVALMTIAITCIGGMYCGFLANHIDIAPNYAGTLVALTNTVATIPGFVVPIFVGYFVKDSVSIVLYIYLYISRISENVTKFISTSFLTVTLKCSSIDFNI